MKNQYQCSGTAMADRAVDGDDAPEIILRASATIGELTDEQQAKLAHELFEAFGVVLVGSVTEAYSLTHEDGTCSPVDPDSFTVADVRVTARVMDQTKSSVAAPMVEAIKDAYAPHLKDGNEVAVYAYMQSGMGFRPDFPQFNLIVPVGEHPEGCTVGVETLAGYGYAPPTIPAADPYANRSTDDNGEFLAN